MVVHFFVSTFETDFRMANDDVIFVRYVPPPQDEEIWVIPRMPVTDIWDYELNWSTDFAFPDVSPASLGTPLWMDMWEDIDDDPTVNYLQVD